MNYTDYINEHRRLLDWLSSNTNAIDKLCEKIITTFEQGGKILLAGNGGSFGDAQHIAAEFIGRFIKNRKSLPAIALGTNASIVTAVSNDFDYNIVFKRELEGIANTKDLFIPLSTSGNSQNLIEACKYASEQNIAIFALLGRDGGKLASIASDSIIVPSQSTAHVQEMHITIGHMVCTKIDELF